MLVISGQDVEPLVGEVQARSVPGGRGHLRVLPDLPQNYLSEESEAGQNCCDG